MGARGWQAPEANEVECDGWMSVTRLSRDDRDFIECGCAPESERGTFQAPAHISYGRENPDRSPPLAFAAHNEMIAMQVIVVDDAEDFRRAPVKHEIAAQGDLCAQTVHFPAPERKDLFVGSNVSIGKMFSPIEPNALIVLGAPSRLGE